MADHDDYLWDRAGTPDPEVAALEQLLAPLAHTAPLRARHRRAPRLAIGAALAITAVAVAATAIIIVRRPVVASCRGTRAGFAFTSRGGAVACGGDELAAGVLPVGGSLDTGAHPADLAIADIGSAELGAHTRVHLARTDAEHHELALDLGHLHARVAAPPRLFVVDTAGARVIDLGCEYTIDVDATGAGAIDVQVGEVELQTDDGDLVVAPAATHTAILAGRRPGLPLARSASGSLIDAVAEYERTSSDAARARVLESSTGNDAITVVDLAAIDHAHRAETLARLAEISPPPTGITIASAVRSPDDFAAWRSAVVTMHLAIWRPGIGSKLPQP